MFSKSLVASLTLVALAYPAFSAPVPNVHAELEARLSLPSGAIGGLIKSLGSGILTGGAFAGLEKLLDLGGDDAAPARRELEGAPLSPFRCHWWPHQDPGKWTTHRWLVISMLVALAAVLEKLVGAGGASLGTVIKNAVLGGVASGVAIEGVNSVAERGFFDSFENAFDSAPEDELPTVGPLHLGPGIVIPSKRAIEDLSDDQVNTLLEWVNEHVDDKGVLSARAGLGSVIGTGLVGGLGSALGGLGIGAILEKLFGYASHGTSLIPTLEDLSDDQVNTLLEWINDNVNTNEARALQLGSVGKGLAGLLAGLGATQGIEAIIEGVKDQFRREISINDLD
ncbi:hypothetical protein C8J57DRAFT_1240385 [Mycena rebaudengoi]|nr:hypothetical protein C8J57DRAFT_1240385 [Mycena rebaudengoi]